MEDEFNYTVTPNGTDEQAFVNGSTDDQDIIKKCISADDKLAQSSRVMFFFAIVMIFALSFIVRRKGLCLRCCCGRPGAVQPVDFVDEIGRRWAYGACFVILTSDVFDLFVDNDFWYILPPDDTEWMKKFGWVKVFTKLLGVLSVCIAYFPLLACVDHRRSICANVLGIICVLPWIVIYCQFFLSCPMSSELDLGFDEFVFKAPIFVSLFIVGFSYVLDFGINVKKWKQQRARKRAAEKNKSIVVSRYGSRRYKIGHHLQYVETLMRRKDTGDVEDGNGVKVKFQRTASRLKYQKVFGFRYSTRLICCVTLCTTLLVWLEFTIVRVTESLLILSSALCMELEPALGDFQTFEGACTSLLAVKIVAHFSSAFSTVVVFIMLIHTLITYKRRWHQLLRGDHSWHMLSITTPHSTLLNGLKYGGYQVAFLIWDWLVLMFFVFAVLMFITFAFIIPLRDGVKNWLIEQIEDKWPTVLLGVIIIPLIQRLICRFLFLQERGTVLALTNRRIYNAASYYFLILNIIVGIFSCLKRILIPLVLGVAFLSRLDQPLIMHGYESRDPGYVAFVSMLIVDLYHNHPVLKAFVELMDQVRSRKEPALEEDINGPDFIALREKNLRSKRIRNRWWKIVTLANNPSLALKALEQRLIRERLQITEQISEDTETKNDAKKQERAYL